MKYETASTQKRGNKRSADKLDELPEDRVLQGDSDVWVLGDSIPFWAGNRAEDTGNHNLRLTCTIAWWSERGLRLKDLHCSIEAQVLLSSAPSIVKINLGGNAGFYLCMGFSCIF